MLTTAYRSTTLSGKYYLAPYHQFLNAQERLKSFQWAGQGTKAEWPYCPSSGKADWPHLMQCQNCGSNVGIAVPHRNLNNAIIYMVIDHCSYDFFTISYRHRISDISTAILTFDQGRQKWPLLTPKKSKYEGQKKGHSPNPCWHGLFAKKRVQIGLIWPPWPHLYFTSAYRGSPPCTLFQHPDNREIGYSYVLAKQYLISGDVLNPGSG